MARRVGYTFKNQYKEINFVYDKFHDIYEAVAAAEGIDLTRYLAMEAQVAMTSKGSQAVKDYRQKEFARFGFSDIHFIRDENAQDES
ncbi:MULTISPECIES: DUF2960 domain-containing protein [Shewanella]|uniref:DUF2960 domain-containing protein n=1 Tax=Shewanella TaxID=22 RepID=UPI001C65D330|nr:MULTISPECIES: DUF2960 domain-containing protein [Shewanella]QYJ83344.1 DUF2960 domain-containing protein [Shewanella aegiceratis]QYJ89138.1 DUF2960 domain-containing protein [Shewanella halotolerans]